MNDHLRKQQALIRSCTRCVEAGFIDQAGPILAGNAAARYMVIGQAPGPTAVERPLPYSGATGVKLQAWMKEAGFDAGDFHDPDVFYLTSLTKCFPGKATSGSGDRPPGRQEIALCSDHLDTELKLVQPEVILPLGRLSISRLLPSMRRQPLSDIIGHSYPAELPAAGTAMVLPLPHPSGVSRWLNDSDHQQLLADALNRLSKLRQELAHG